LIIQCLGVKNQKQMHRLEEIRSRKASLLWNNVLHELTTERNAWGSGAEEEVDVSSFVRTDVSYPLNLVTSGPLDVGSMRE
jgi:hypothetical protein